MSADKVVQIQSKKSRHPRRPAPQGDGALSDSLLAEVVAEHVLSDRYCYATGLGWMRWDGCRWASSSDVEVVEAVRTYLREMFTDAAATAKSREAVEAYLQLLSSGKVKAVAGLTRGIVLRKATEFDRHPDLLNTPTGVVDLRTGELRPHDPALMLTKVTSAGYRPGATHPDWDTALQALPDEVRDWYQVRLGQGITGHMTPDDVMIVAQGGGENGKSSINGATQRVLGDYFVLLSHRVLLADAGAHPTEMMSLRGARVAVMEELPERHKLSVTRLKQVVGTPQITARYIRRDEVTFDATHSLFISTNYEPIVDETDHGTWRRLLLVCFPYTYRKPGEQLRGDHDRRGDPTLRDRIALGQDGQHEAALAWLVEGARRWYKHGQIMPTHPARVVSDSRKWRSRSDLVLAYMDEHLVNDPDTHVLCADLFEHFSGWLESRSQSVWSDRTFAARFGGHDEVTRAGIAKVNIRARDGLSRPTATAYQSPPADRYRAWIGVRFRTEADWLTDEQTDPN